MLIDTGWHTDLRTDPVKYLGCLHLKTNVPDLPPGQAIHEQLAKRGIKTSDVDYVVLTHMDDDHAGGVKHVADAKNILVSEPEWKSANNKLNIRYRRGMWNGVRIKTFNYKPSKYDPAKLAYDLFKDESVMLLYAPGHSAGMASTLVQANDKFVLLTADAAYAKKSWEQMISPGITMDPKKAVESLAWVKMMSQQPGCIEVLATHDPEVVPHTIEL